MHQAGNGEWEKEEREKVQGVWWSGNEEREEEVRKEIKENGGGTSGKEECEK